MSTLRTVIYFIPILGLILDSADLAFDWNTTEIPREKSVHVFSVIWHTLWTLYILT